MAHSFFRSNISVTLTFKKFIIPIKIRHPLITRSNSLLVWIYSCSFNKRSDRLSIWNKFNCSAYPFSDWNSIFSVWIIPFNLFLQPDSCSFSTEKLISKVCGVRFSDRFSKVSSVTRRRLVFLPSQHNSNSGNPSFVISRYPQFTSVSGSRSDISVPTGTRSYTSIVFPSCSNACSSAYSDTLWSWRRIVPFSCVNVSQSAVISCSFKNSCSFSFSEEEIFWITVGTVSPSFNNLMLSRPCFPIIG